ncbi:MAG: erythronate-4-phosphate dehydrogenase, partial [Muribaculaceae bacterium]|nr:erythronate-4-phosphate dehydrogenase [Muribaculaceae bacterium]
MKPVIVIESHIPYIKGVFDHCADVRYLAPEEISPAAVRDADALVVRTRTRCDAALLDGSRCRVIATATIGTDHIDGEYCRHRGIAVANAPGCNAPAVAQYVFASLAGLCRSGVLGVVGVGHVGRIVADWGRELGFEVLLNDPPRQYAGDSGDFHSLAEIAERADVVTFHTPLVRDGSFPSYHLAGEEFFASLKRRPVIVNAARGPVVDTGALLGAMDSGRVGAAVI